MRSADIIDTIHIDSYSATPKYLQLAYSVLEAIQTGKLARDTQLPSLNELTASLEISKETADKGYKYLQELGVLNIIPGKGHFVASVDFKQEQRILLLINKLSEEKKMFYDSFTAALGLEIPIDFYVYNNDFALFRKLLTANSDKYSHYVIMPHFLDYLEEAERLINDIPKEKLIILDRKLSGVSGNYGCVFEDFEKDIYSGLEKVVDRLSKYHTLNLVFPMKSYFSRSIIKGFNSFCLEYAFGRNIMNSLEGYEIKDGEAFICLTDGDLVTLIEKLEQSHFRAGAGVGVISYNETPLKKFILNGITTISTDYREMGRLAAGMIQGNYREKVSLPFRVNLRPSL